jgi:two-component sensor histidine kinase
MTDSLIDLLSRKFASDDWLNSLPVAVYACDVKGRIAQYNRRAAELWGREPKLGDDDQKFCGALRLFRDDGTELPHAETPMAETLRTGRPEHGKAVEILRPDGSSVVVLVHIDPVLDDDNQLAGAVNMLVDISERKKAERDQRLLINELNHRVSNTLATVQSIARQTFRCAPDPGEFVESFGGRVNALAAAHSVLTRETWRGAELTELIDGQLVMEDAERSRVRLKGPAITLRAQTALHLSLLLHELGTNARKHGALAAPNGRLELTWSVSDHPDRMLQMVWRERGVENIAAPQHHGFGSTLIEMSLQPEGGRADTTYLSDGIMCEISVPLPDAAPERDAQDGRRRRTDGGEIGIARAPARRRVLLVEDEPFVAMDIEAILADAGFEVVGPAGDHESAVELARNSDFDVALLDANLNGRHVGAIAAELTRRNIPFAFASGYGREGLPEGFGDATLLSKPFSNEVLLRAVETLGERRGDVVPLKAGQAQRSDNGGARRG